MFYCYSCIQEKKFLPYTPSILPYTKRKDLRWHTPIDTQGEHKELELLRSIGALTHSKEQKSCAILEGGSARLDGT